MRYISHRHLQRIAKLDDLRAAEKELKAADPKERAAVMKKHDAVCSAVRTKLWLLGAGKCWYSEAILTEGEGHVEHYRPKRRLWGVSHDGYWWRAFDWTNLRLAHPIANKRMTDYVTGRKGGKGSYFPIKDEAHRANDEAHEKSEVPSLLDPIRPSDATLLAFMSDSGAPTPAYSVNQNPWLHRRAIETIDCYHLNEATWNMKRHNLMMKVSVLCTKIEDVSAEVPRDDNAYNDLIDELIDFIEPYAEFSAACRQIVQERGLLEHINLGVR